MENIIPMDRRPRVFTSAFLRHLAEANRVVRRLRRLGCRVIRQQITDAGSEIVVDRNPHRQVIAAPSVHVTWGRP